MSYRNRLALAAAVVSFAAAAHAQVQASPAATATPSAATAPAATATVAGTIAGSAEHTTLTKLFAAAGLDQTLAATGPFTVFAPTDDAFTRVPAGTVDTLLKPAAKPALVKLMNYLVVPGKLTLADIETQAKAGGGKATLTTVEGEPLIVTFENGAVKLTDVDGNPSYVSKGDIGASNGVVHAINGMVLPKQ
jgi:uncharacterized surface protein with fasciclin (FAS1) repeats